MVKANLKIRLFPSVEDILLKKWCYNLQLYNVHKQGFNTFKTTH